MYNYDQISCFKLVDQWTALINYTVKSDGANTKTSTRVLTNSKFGLFYSNFLILTPTFSKVPIEKYGKNPIFPDKQHFYSYFQNPSENTDQPNQITAEINLANRT